MQRKYFFDLKCPALTLICCLFLFFPAHAQTNPDSTAHESRKRSNRIALQSAMLPGLGQARNHKYWKIPIIYTGFGVLIYFIDANNDSYQTYKTAYLYRNDNDATTVDDFPNYTSDDLKVRKDFYRRNRDLSYILTGVLYTLNIIDAYVDAQLKDFDVSDDLSLRTDPFVGQLAGGENFAGLRLTFTLK